MPVSTHLLSLSCVTQIQPIWMTEDGKLHRLHEENGPPSYGSPQRNNNNNSLNLALVDVELFRTQRRVAFDQDGFVGHLFQLL